MYEEFYKLQSDPFALSPTGQHTFEHSSYKKAKSYLEYALHRGEGMVLITGQPGTGKTTLVKELVWSLNGSETVVRALTCQNFTARELVRHFALVLGSEFPKDELSTALMNIQEALRNHREQGRRAVLVLDEAQSLEESALEQARLLSNYQAGDQPLLQIVLVGQPELRQKILSPGLKQLHQRIVTSSDLKPLSESHTKDYFMHRMKAAGWSDKPKIDNDVFEVMHKASEGIPRWINQIGSRLLLRGMIEEKNSLSRADIVVVVEDLVSESLLPQSVRAESKRLLHSISSNKPETEG